MSERERKRKKERERKRKKEREREIDRQYGQVWARTPIELV